MQQRHGDPRFVEVPEDRMLSRSRAKGLAAGVMAGNRRGGVDVPGQASETTHVSVVDQWGNAAAITHSNGNTAGVVTPGLGFLYNHHMHNFDPRVGQRNSVAPGKRPLFGCSPLMLLEDGQLKLVSGSKSRYRVTAEIQVLLDLLEFGAELPDAIDHFRIHAEYAADTIYLEPNVPPNVGDELLAMGWKCPVVDMAVPMCTIMNHGRGGIESAADPRGGGGLWLA